MKINFVFAIIFVFNACNLEEDKSSSGNTLAGKRDGVLIIEKLDSIVFTCDYLGEKPPGKIPKIFAPKIISTNDLHSSLYFSPDGNELYYSRLTSNGDPSGVLCKRKVNGIWEEPILIPNTEKALTPFLSVDGNKLFCSLPSDLYVFYKSTNGWGHPENLGEEINFQKRQDGISESSFGTIFYTAMFGSNDGIYYAECINYTYQSPKKLITGLPANPATGYPYIAPDESYLIFASRVQGGFGASDLYIMFKTENGKWSQAINMGKNINTSNSESFSNVTPDGKYLFFNSNRISVVNSIVPNHFYGNIYWIDAIIIDELR